MPPRVFAGLVLSCFTAAISVSAGTTITLTRTDVSNMANLWETDCVSVSSLVNEQYPSVAGTWDYIFPHSNISSDGDIHIDMAINASGTGSTSSNTGASPLICEVINSTSSQLNHLTSLAGQAAMFRGIFRFYTEHAGERHFELHPVTQLQKWNGSTFVADTDYHANIGTDPNGNTHSTSTLVSLLDGSQTISAMMANDNVNVTFTLPSPSVNYVQYDGIALSGIQSDALSQYFLFQPNLVPDAMVRCRIVANTASATAAAALTANTSVTVNALTRTDMSDVATRIASLGAGQQTTFARPIELIVLGLPNVGVTPTPTPTPTPSPSPSPSATVSPTVTPTPQPSATATMATFSNTSPIAMNTTSDGKANPYPAAISVTGLLGEVTDVSVKLNAMQQTDSHDAEEDIDILLVSPNGVGVKLMSDVGSATNPLGLVDLTFVSDFAASHLPSDGPIVSGTYRPTDFGQTDPFPSPSPNPSPTPSTFFVTMNGQDPNSTWNLYMVDDQPSHGAGSIGGGWSLTIKTRPAPPLVVRSITTDKTSTTAMLNGTVDPLGQFTTYQWQIGPDRTYAFKQTPQPIGNGTAALPANLKLFGLKPGSVYNYQLTARNASGQRLSSESSFGTAPFVDSDGDGMPNDYETANGFNPNNPADGMMDADFDGYTNYQEYVAGTDPHSATSVLPTPIADKSTGDAVISFQSVFGKTYRIEQATELGSSWSTLTDNIFGTGGIISVSDVEAFDETQRRFYRVVIIP